MTSDGMRRALLGAAIAACAANGGCAKILGDFERGCPESTVECDGACVDLGSDKLHCGKCGYVCGSGVCTKGACEIARSQDGPTFVAVDDGHIYWANASGGHTQTQIVVATKEGSSVATLAFDEGTPAAFAMDDDYVYWATFETEATSGHIARIPKAGGAQPEIVDTDAAAQPRGLIVDGKFAYWGNVADASIYRKDPSDPSVPAEAMATLQLNINQLAHVKDALFWDAAFGIVRAPAVGTVFGEGALVSEESKPILNMVNFEQDVFWLRPDSGDVVELPEDGLPSVLAHGLSFPAGLVADEENVTWAAHDGSVGLVYQVSRTGNKVDRVAETEGLPAAVAADQDSVYWVDIALGKVMKHARP